MSIILARLQGGTAQRGRRKGPGLPKKGGGGNNLFLGQSEAIQNTQHNAAGG